MCNRVGVGRGGEWGDCEGNLKTIKNKPNQQTKKKIQENRNFNLCKDSTLQGEIRKKANDAKKYIQLFQYFPSRIQKKSKIYIKKTVYKTTSNRKEKLTEHQRTREK